MIVVLGVIDLYHVGGGQVVNDPCVHLTGGQCQLRITVGGIGVYGIAAAHTVAFCGGAGLNGHGFAVEVRLAGDSAALRDNDGLCCQTVGIGEQHILFPLRGHGDAGHAHIVLAGLYAGQNRVKVHLLDVQRYAQIRADQVQKVDLNTDDFVIVQGFKGREVGAGGDDQLAGLLHIAEGGAAAAAAGQAQGQHHGR